VCERRRQMDVHRLWIPVVSALPTDRIQPLRQLGYALDVEIQGE
jgi:hypothetical protein